MHVHTLILADHPSSVRREEARDISRIMQQIERQEPCSVSCDKDMSTLFYSMLHSAITSLLQASSLDWFVSSPSAPGAQSQHAAGRGAGRGLEPGDGSGGGGSTTRRSEGGGVDNAPSWLTMDGQVCRCFPTPQAHCHRACNTGRQVLWLARRLGGCPRVQACATAARSLACVCSHVHYNTRLLLHSATDT